MAKIYVLNIAECESVLSALLPKISEKRSVAAQRVAIKNKNASLEKIASEVLLAYSLKQTLPLSYKLQKNGKPYIPTLPFFNISHSFPFVACAVSNKEVGVDVEKVSRMKTTLSRQILSDTEYKNSETVSGAKLLQLLCEKWVRKEAYLKMLGIGLKRSMTDLTFVGDELVGEDVFSRVYNVEGHLLSFCRSEKVPVSIITVTASDLIEYFSLDAEQI